MMGRPGGCLASLCILGTRYKRGVLGRVIYKCFFDVRRNDTQLVSFFDDMFNFFFIFQCRVCVKLLVYCFVWPLCCRYMVLSIMIVAPPLLAFLAVKDGSFFNSDYFYFIFIFWWGCLFFFLLHLSQITTVTTSPPPPSPFQQYPALQPSLLLPIYP